ncbi:M64 family metallopeptidase [Kitasatospora purpeofusca]|uniref:M64 family metallopeptidase n=1 Tax=Kitasatospora purpeofusca TaxID=67352 RepID=UPI00324392EF
MSLRAFTTAKHLHVAGGIRQPMRADGTSSLRSWLRSDLSASEVPWLAASVTTLFRSGPPGSKITLAVVGDGFGPQDQDAYNTAVDRLLTNGLFAQDFFGEHRSAFNLVRVNLVSLESGVGTKTYDANGTVVGQVDRDTALGAYYNGDWAHLWVEDGPSTADRLTSALSELVPERQLVLVVLNSPGFGGRGGNWRATVPLGIGWSTIAHEFGHAMGGLGDEYHERNETYGGTEPTAPNLTTNTDRATLKWGWIVGAETPLPTGGDDCTPPKPAGWNDSQDVGLFEGGGGSYRLGVYRPVVNCRMRSNEPRFCPVCAGAMEAVTAPHRDGAPLSGVGPGDTTALLSEGDGTGYVRLVVRLEQGTLRVLEARELDGPFVQTGLVTQGFAHEVRIGGRRVALGSLPDAGVSRGFSEIGTDGPREHLVYRPDAFDFVVRVASAELRGADLSELTVDLVSVGANRGDALGEVPLREDPALDVTPIASLADLSVADLPTSLRRIVGPE